MSFTAIALALLALPLSAEEDHTGHGGDTHHHREEIVVTADPLGRSTDHIVQPTRVLGADELLKRDTGSIGAAVADELGISSSDFGPGVGRPVIRGLSGSRVRVLEDGIGSMDVSTISPDHAVALEPIFAEQVEIYRGPASLLYGSGATGGFVNSASNRIHEMLPERLSAELYAHYDSASDGYLTAIEADGAIGDFALHVDAMKRDTNNIDIPGFGPVSPDADAREGTLENSDTDAEHYAGGISWIGTRAFAGFSVSGFDNEYGVPGEGHHHEEDGDDDEEEEEGGVRIEQEQTRVDFKAGIDQPFAGVERIRLRGAVNDHEHAEVEPSGEVGTLLQNDEFEIRLEVTHEPIAGWDGVVGMQYRDREFDATGEEAFVPDSELDAIGVFVLEQRDMGEWHFELGARYEHQSAEALDFDPDHDLFSGSFGVRRTFMDNYQIGFSYVHANRAPSLEELFSDGAHLATNTFEIGDASLDTEVSNNFDLSFSRIAGRTTWTVNLFYNRIDDFIYLQENDLNGDGVADRVEEDFDGDPADILPPDEDDEPLLVNYVQDDAEFYGLEAEAIFDLIDDSRGHLDLRVWGDYVRGKLTGGDGDLPRISPHRFGASFAWERRGWSAGLDYIRTGKQASTAALESKTPSFDMLNLDLRYTGQMAQGSWTGFVRATNLFDETARRHVSFLKDQAPLPGRAALVGVRLRF